MTSSWRARIDRLVRQELGEAEADARDGRAVVGDHREAEGNRQDQAHERAERQACAALGAGQGRADPEPGDQDDGEAAKQVRAEPQEQIAVPHQQVQDGRGDTGKRINAGHRPTSLGNPECRERGGRLRGRARQERARLIQERDVRVDALRGGLASVGRVEQLLLEQRRPARCWRPWPAGPTVTAVALILLSTAIWVLRPASVA